MHSLEPREAIDKYLQSREHEVAEFTLQSHESRLRYFKKWCDEQGIDDMSELDGMRTHAFKQWRWDQGEEDLATATMKSAIDTFRRFIRFCEGIEAVPQGLSEKITSPSLSKGEDAREEMLDPEVGESILDYLSTYDYASRDHVTMMLMTRCLLRRGAIRAIDVDDVNLDDNTIEMRHRPDEGTPLKNQWDAERFLAVKPRVSTVLEDYQRHHRHSITAGSREPLITTKQGRIHVNTIASAAYAVTRPCHTTGECPHGEDIDACDAAQNRQLAYQCPSSNSPHEIRRGAITRWLSEDVPKNVISDRCSTSMGVLDDHYDGRDEATKAEQRRDYLID